jgi:hypothetical protein
MAVAPRSSHRHLSLSPDPSGLFLIIAKKLTFLDVKSVAFYI